LSDRHDIEVEYKCWDPPLPSTLCSIAPPDLKAGGAIPSETNRLAAEQIQTETLAKVLAPTAVLGSAPVANPLFNQIVPPAMMAFGLGFTAIWVCLVGYGLVKLIDLAI
jgi:hypothetical protein